MSGTTPSIRATARWLGRGYTKKRIGTDRPEENPGSIAIAAGGNSVAFRDVTGARTRQDNLILWFTKHTHTDTDREQAHEAIHELAEWIEEQADALNFPTIPGHEVEAVEAANILLADAGDSGTGIYQLQISITYTEQRSDS